MTSELSVVLPVFDEIAILPELHRRLVTVCDGTGIDVEVIYVDDGSQDGSVEYLRELAQQDLRVRVVELSRNFGHSSAVMAGLEQAEGRAVVIMDSDLQDPPALIIDFLERWREGYEVVYAVKTKRDDPWLRRMLFSGFHRLYGHLSNGSSSFNAGTYCLLDRRVVEVMCHMLERHRYLPGLRAWIGFRQTGIEYERAERFAGSPRQSLTRLLRLAMDAIVSFSFIPLRLATYLGLLVATAAFVLIIIVLYFKLFTDKALLGWASVTVSILFLGGIQLCMMGIMGEYIGRIYDEVKQRPYFVVKKVWRADRSSGDK